jgi:hypothetical protein
MVGKVRPLVTGAVMGIVTVYMIHGDKGNLGITALAVLLAADILVILLLVTAACWTARLSPTLRTRIDRLHRPSVVDLRFMAAGAAVAIPTTYLFLNREL